MRSVSVASWRRCLWFGSPLYLLPLPCAFLCYPPYLTNIHIRCDIVFYAGKEHNGVTRSNFLARSHLNYDSYDLVRSTHVSEDIREGAGWTYNLAQLIRKLNPETASLLQADPSQDDFRNLKSLSKYCSLYRIAQSKKGKAKRIPDFTRLWSRETAACKELALDLAHSESIYSLLKPSGSCANSFKSEPPPDGTDALILATQALSLRNDDPPDPEFGYLKPRFLGVASGQNPNGDDPMEDVTPSPQENGEKTFKFSLPVRLLLSEWQLGTPVDSYAFVDPYDLKNQNWRYYSQARQSNIMSDVKPGPIQPSNYRQPEVPPVVASSQPPLGNDTSLKNRWGSVFPHAQSQSSDMDWSAMPSTQPMPGRYGGRPSLPLPKKTPKRLGGF